MEGLSARRVVTNNFRHCPLQSVGVADATLHRELLGREGGREGGREDMDQPESKSQNRLPNLLVPSSGRGEFNLQQLLQVVQNRHSGVPGKQSKHTGMHHNPGPQLPLS